VKISIRSDGYFDGGRAVAVSAYDFSDCLIEKRVFCVLYGSVRNSQVAGWEAIKATCSDDDHSGCPSKESK
jgi:hypothetical protein